MLQAVKDFTRLWDCKDLGELKEYVGCKVDWTEETIRLTILVKIQRFEDKFECNGATARYKAPTTPAPAGTVLDFNKDLEEPLPGKKQTEH